MRALREIRAQAAGEPAEEQSSSSFIYGSVSRPPTATILDVQPLLRAFYNGRDAQLMSGGELHAIVAWLSKQQGYAHADLEDKVLRIRSLGDKKNYLAKHIREQCANLIANEQPEGMCARRPNSCAPYAIPQSAGARYSESRPSSRCSHPEYNAGGQMSQMMYPSLHHTGVPMSMSIHISHIQTNITMGMMKDMSTSMRHLRFKSNAFELQRNRSDSILPRVHKTIATPCTWKKMLRPLRLEIMRAVALTTVAC
ncbi:hypothetical protein AB1Y20_006843 [Prymnesium parvum]|uniref:Uncharacterized protein n=1 Tax=Prymnesium parvum TaxID=97485 RepID=A0AB34J109_PRYPA